MGCRVSGLILSEIREALSVTIRNGIGRQTNVYAYPVEDPAPPAVTIEPDATYVDYWSSMGGRGLSIIRFVLVLEPGGNDLPSALRRLDDYLSLGTGNSSSLVGAVMADRTLGLTGCDCTLVDCVVDPETATARLTVEIHISKIGAL
jgi:hypothetical protein